MICPPCRAGGELIRDAKAVSSEMLQYKILEDAAKVHALCEQPATCPCHHSVTLEAVAAK